MDVKHNENGNNFPNLDNQNTGKLLALYLSSKNSVFKKEQLLHLLTKQNTRRGQPGSQRNLELLEGLKNDVTSKIGLIELLKRLDRKNANDRKTNLREAFALDAKTNLQKRLHGNVLKDEVLANLVDFPILRRKLFLKFKENN